MLTVEWKLIKRESSKMLQQKKREDEVRGKHLRKTSQRSE